MIYDTALRGLCTDIQSQSLCREVIRLSRCDSERCPNVERAEWRARRRSVDTVREVLPSLAGSLGSTTGIRGIASFTASSGPTSQDSQFAGLTANGEVDVLLLIVLRLTNWQDGGLSRHQVQNLISCAPFPFQRHRNQSRLDTASSCVMYRRRRGRYVVRLEYPVSHRSHR
jgi:hypothetical protein